MKHPCFSVVVIITVILLSCKPDDSEALKPLWAVKLNYPVCSVQKINRKELGVKTVDRFYTISQSTGRMISSVLLPAQGVAGALFDNNRLYFGSSDRRFRCLDVVENEIVWEFQTRSENSALPAVGSQNIY